MTQTDAIVRRLRGAAGYRREFGSSAGADIFDAAAEEIERLRGQVENRDAVAAAFDDAGREGWPDRMDMIHQLHEAVYGHTGARPDTPQQVWEELLAKVREMHHWIGASM